MNPDTNNKTQGGTMHSNPTPHRYPTKLPSEARRRSGLRRACRKLSAPAYRSLRVFAGSFALFVLLTGIAQAGRYELVNGNGVGVCEAYAKNLNSFEPPYPMVCERRVNPELIEFKKPDWAKPSLDQARTLEFDMAKLMSRVLNQPEPKNESEIKVRTEDDPGWPARRWIATVDIDNDGTSDIVLKQQDGNCPTQRAFSVHISVLTRDGKHYDLEKSQYIDADRSALLGQLSEVPKPWDRRTAGLSKNDFWGYSLYDVFLYKDVTYFDLWEMGKGYPNPSVGRLHVFSWKNGTTRETCAYRFVTTD